MKFKIAPRLHEERTRSGFLWLPRRCQVRTYEWQEYEGSLLKTLVSDQWQVRWLCRATWTECYSHIYDNAGSGFFAWKGMYWLDEDSND